MAHDAYCLLIARKNGSSSSRRQRGFPAEKIDAAIDRWRTEGFNTWWLYGARPTPGADRPLIREWQDATMPPPVDDDDEDREPTHPATGEPTNAARAARVDAVLVEYAERMGMTDEPPETVAQDFLTDVLHWLHAHGQLDDGTTPSDIATAAVRMFEDERGMEAEIDATGDGDGIARCSRCWQALQPGDVCPTHGALAPVGMQQG